MAPSVYSLTNLLEQYAIQTVAEKGEGEPIRGKYLRDRNTGDCHVRTCADINWCSVMVGFLEIQDAQTSVVSKFTAT
jgi:hypothetical protein